MLSLTGTYDCKLDSKNRLAVPSNLLKQLPPENDGRFVVNRGFETHLKLYTSAEWENIRQSVDALNRFDPKVRRFVRNFYNYASSLQLDSHNRLLLPKNLLEYAAIQNELVIYCLGSEIEIWNPDLYQQANAMTPQEFSDMATELLVNQPPQREE